MAPDNLHDVAQTVRERCRGVLGKSVRGEQLSVGELRHDVDEREGEGTQVLPGWVRSQVDGELVLQLLKVKVERLVVPRDASLRGI
jgi:hypothetical protein